MKTVSTNNTSAQTIRAEVAEKKQNLYVIEREISGAGKLGPEELQAISVRSNGVLEELGPEITWLHSYVTGDKIFCVYTAPNEDLIKEHATKGGFPANSVSKVNNIIDPSTGNS